MLFVDKFLKIRIYPKAHRKKFHTFYLNIFKLINTIKFKYRLDL